MILHDYLQQCLIQIETVNLEKRKRSYDALSVYKTNHTTTDLLLKIAMFVEEIKWIDPETNTEEESAVTTNIVYACLFIYVERFLRTVGIFLKDLPPNVIYGLFTVALVLVYKYHDDLACFDQHFARMFNIYAEDLLHMQLNFLNTIGWNLNTTAGELEEKEQLANFILKSSTLHLKHTDAVFSNV